MKFHRLESLIVGWADQALPQRTEAAGFLKLFEELGEVLSNPDDPGEWADVFIMLIDLANRRRIDIPRAVMAKLAVLQTREWTRTSTGTYQHVPGNASPRPSVGLVIIQRYVNGPWGGVTRRDAIDMDAEPPTAVGCPGSDEVGFYVLTNQARGYDGWAVEYTWVGGVDVPF